MEAGTVPLSNENSRDLSRVRVSGYSLITRIRSSALLLCCGFTLVGFSNFFVSQAHAVRLEGICPELYEAFLQNPHLEEIALIYKKLVIAGCVEEDPEIPQAEFTSVDIAAVKQDLEYVTETSSYSDQTPTAENSEFGLEPMEKFTPISVPSVSQ